MCVCFTHKFEYIKYQRSSIVRLSINSIRFIATFSFVIFSLFWLFASISNAVHSMGFVLFFFIHVSVCAYECCFFFKFYILRSECHEPHQFNLVCLHIIQSIQFHKFVCIFLRTFGVCQSFVWPFKMKQYNYTMHNQNNKAFRLMLICIVRVTAWMWWMIAGICPKRKMPRDLVKPFDLVGVQMSSVCAWHFNRNRVMPNNCVCVCVRVNKTCSEHEWILEFCVGVCNGWRR